MPAFAPVATFATEQIYICNRDGYDLRPLTTRDGLIYFALSWAPDGHALTALACKESEWNAREKEFKAPEGRPRVISLDGQERLLDDQMAEAGKPLRTSRLYRSGRCPANIFALAFVDLKPAGSRHAAKLTDTVHITTSFITEVKLSSFAGHS